jgi:hypothetical protein
MSHKGGGPYGKAADEAADQTSEWGARPSTQIRCRKNRAGVVPAPITEALGYTPLTYEGVARSNSLVPEG